MHSTRIRLFSLDRMMDRFYCLALVVVFAIGLSEAQRLYVRDKLVRLEPLNDAHMGYLRALEENSTLDFWTDVMVPNKPVDVHIQESEFERYVSQFKQYSLPFRVLLDDIQQVIDQEQEELAQDRLIRQMKSRLLGETKADIVGTYVSYADILTYLDEKAAADPSRVSVIDLGKTFQGRSLKIVALKYNPSATRNIWIDCGIHARGKWPAFVVSHLCLRIE